jgi:hypothetical protein
MRQPPISSLEGERDMSSVKEISEATGFDMGDFFTSESEVRQYFDISEMRSQWRTQARWADSDWDGGDKENIEDTWGAHLIETVDADTLESWANLVIKHQWHCEFKG